MISKPLPKKKIDYFNADDLLGNLKSHAIRGGGITFISRSTAYFIQIVSTIVLVRILTPWDFGIIAMVTAICGPFMIFTDMGLTDATIQEQTINHEQVSTLFWINLLVCSGIVLLLILFSPLIASFYKEDDIKLITIIWSSNIFFVALSAQHMALLKRRMLFSQISIVRILAAFICNAAAILLALYGWKYWSLVGRTIISALVMTVGAWIVCRWRPGMPKILDRTKALVFFGAKITGSYIIGYFTRSLDKILIGWRYGSIQLGFYEKAFWLSELPSSQLSSSIQNVAIATLSKVRSDPVRYRHYYLNAISVISFIGMPLSLYFIVESENLIHIFLGTQWDQSVDIFKILAAATGIRVIYSTFYWLHVSQGRADRLMRWVIFSTFFTSCGIIIGLKYGPKGVALGYTLALTGLTAIGLQYAGRPIGLRLNRIIRVIYKNIAASILAGLFSSQIIVTFAHHLNRPLRLFVSLIFFFVTYIVLVVILNWSLNPIIEFLSVLKELRPGKSVNS